LPGYGYNDERSQYDRRWSDDGYVAVAEPRSYSGGVPPQRYPDQYAGQYPGQSGGRRSLYDVDHDRLEDYEEPEKPRRKITKAALIAAAVVALLVVGLATFAGAILLGGSGGKGTDKTNAAADTNAQPSLDPNDGGNGRPVVPSDAAAPDPTPSSTPAAKTTTTAPAAPLPTAKKKPPVTKTTAPSTANLPAEAAVLVLVNTERAKAGCKAVTNDSRLAAAARKHSADMVARDYFSHTTPDGVDFATRITEEGYRFSSAGENIAAGQRTPADVMNAWMNSPGHRANILNCGFKNLGVGIALDGNRPTWTQDFGTER
jgi:uncharacterized protein YkwD